MTPCPVCGLPLEPERDPDDGTHHLPLHGAWPTCAGSGRRTAAPERTQP